MVSGYDKSPPAYEPDFGWGGKLLAVFLVLAALSFGFGWMLV
jgi:hypothetical protein